MLRWFGRPSKNAKVGVCALNRFWDGVGVGLGNQRSIVTLEVWGLEHFLDFILFSMHLSLYCYEATLDLYCLSCYLQILEDHDFPSKACMTDGSVKGLATFSCYEDGTMLPQVIAKVHFESTLQLAKKISRTSNWSQMIEEPDEAEFRGQDTALFGLSWWRKTSSRKLSGSLPLNSRNRSLRLYPSFYVIDTSEPELSVA